MANNRYIDFDINFNPHPVTGDVFLKKDNNAIKQSLRNLLLTDPYEYPFEPDKSSKIKAYLFEPIAPSVASSLKDSIRAVINQHEPRIELIDVSVYADIDSNGYEITILYNIINIPETITVNFFLERIR